MPQRSLVDVFPQEIIDRILDNLSINPIGAAYEPIMKVYTANINLRACALVCRAFAPRCQCHLFSTLRLRAAEEEGWIERERCRREEVYKVLLSKPHILNAVRHVSVEVGARGMKSVVHEERGDLAHPGLLPLLRELPLSSIEILDGTGNHKALGDGKRYPNPLTIEYYFIHPFIQTTSITFLRISHVVINTSILACFPNLADLDLSEAKFGRSKDYRKIAAHRPRPRLRALRVVPTSLLEEILRVCGSDALPLFDLSQLRILETPLSGDVEDTLMVGRVLNICAQHLEELDLHDTNITDPFIRYARSLISTEWESLKPDNREALWDIDNMGHFPRLSTVHLWRSLMTVEANGSVGFNPLIDYCRFLARVPSPNALGRLDVNICISCPEALSPVCCLEAPGWDGLEYEIVRISDGKVLEVNLNITWNVRSYYKESDKDLHSPRDNSVWKRVMGMLQTILVPAIREKLQRGGQSPWIEFNITTDIHTISTYNWP